MDTSIDVVDGRHLRRVGRGATPVHEGSLHLMLRSSGVHNAVNNISWPFMA